MINVDPLFARSDQSFDRTNPIVEKKVLQLEKTRTVERFKDTQQTTGMLLYLVLLIQILTRAASGSLYKYHLA